MKLNKAFCKKLFKVNTNERLLLAIESVRITIIRPFFLQTLKICQFFFPFTKFLCHFLCIGRKHLKTFNGNVILLHRNMEVNRYTFLVQPQKGQLVIGK